MPRKGQLYENALFMASLRLNAVDAWRAANNDPRGPEDFGEGNALDEYREKHKNDPVFLLDQIGADVIQANPLLVDRALGTGAYSKQVSALPNNPFETVYPSPGGDMLLPDGSQDPYTSILYSHNGAAAADDDEDDQKVAVQEVKAEKVPKAYENKRKGGDKSQDVDNPPGKSLKPPQTPLIPRPVLMRRSPGNNGVGGDVTLPGSLGITTNDAKDSGSSVDQLFAAQDLSLDEILGTTPPASPNGQQAGTGSGPPPPPQPPGSGAASNMISKDEHARLLDEARQESKLQLESDIAAVQARLKEQADKQIAEHKDEWTKKQTAVFRAKFEEELAQAKADLTAAANKQLKETVKTHITELDEKASTSEKAAADSIARIKEQAEKQIADHKDQWTKQQTADFRAQYEAEIESLRKQLSADASKQLSDKVKTHIDELEAKSKERLEQAAAAQQSAEAQARHLKQLLAESEVKHKLDVSEWQRRLKEAEAALMSGNGGGPPGPPPPGAGAIAMQEQAELMDTRRDGALGMQQPTNPRPPSPPPKPPQQQQIAVPLVKPVVSLAAWDRQRRETSTRQPTAVSVAVNEDPIVMPLQRQQTGKPGVTERQSLAVSSLPMLPKQPAPSPQPPAAQQRVVEFKTSDGKEVKFTKPAAPKKQQAAVGVAMNDDDPLTPAQQQKVATSKKENKEEGKPAAAMSIGEEPANLIQQRPQQEQEQVLLKKPLPPPLSQEQKDAAQSRRALDYQQMQYAQLQSQALPQLRPLASPYTTYQKNNRS